MLPKDVVFWHIAKKPSPKKLSKNITADVVIIGGGMTGLSAAQTFLKKGYRVILLEREFCGAGATGKSSGFITPDSELGLGELIVKFGPEQAKKLWDFANCGVSLIRQNIQRHKIVCDFIEQDALFVANNPKAVNSINSEYEARHRFRYGVKKYDKGQITGILGTNVYVAGVRYKDTFVINPYLYAQAMKDVLIREGAEVYEGSPATDIQGYVVRVAGGYTVTAQYILVCTDRNIPELYQRDCDVYHAQTYLLVSRPLGKDLKRVFPEKQMMVWDSDLNYKYFRPIGGSRMLMGGGNIITLYSSKLKHNYSSMFRTLSHYFSKRFSVPIKWEYMWPGMLGVSKDFLPVIEQDSSIQHLYCLGAGAGLPWSAGMGMYIFDKIMHGRNDLDQYICSTRKYPPPAMLQPLLGKKLCFALSHGYEKFIG